uniref:Uncharacterized protein n=1 Tax=Rhizophora mucronata TaxID=61149 RepID=A0A2P2QSX4_RHIMU
MVVWLEPKTGPVLCWPGALNCSSFMGLVC